MLHAACIHDLYSYMLPVCVNHAVLISTCSSYDLHDDTILSQYTDAILSQHDVHLPAYCLHPYPACMHHLSLISST